MDNQRSVGTAVRQEAHAAFVVKRADGSQHFTVLAEGELENYGLGEHGRDGAIRRFREQRGIADEVRVDILPDTHPDVAHMFPLRSIRLQVDIRTTTTRPQLLLRAAAQMLLDYANGNSNLPPGGFVITEGEPLANEEET